MINNAWIQMKENAILFMLAIVLHFSYSVLDPIVHVATVKKVLATPFSTRVTSRPLFTPSFPDILLFLSDSSIQKLLHRLSN